MGSNGPRIGGGYIAFWKLIDTKKIQDSLNMAAAEPLGNKAGLRPGDWPERAPKKAYDWWPAQVTQGQGLAEAKVSTANAEVS
jgi:hypothetical protein